MPNIPYTSQIDARSLRSNNPMSSPDTFGAGVGRAVEQLSGEVKNTANILAEAKARKDAELKASKEATFDPTRQLLELKNQVGENADGYQDEALNKFDEMVDLHVEDIEDATTRQATRESLMRQRPAVSQMGAEYEINLQNKRSEDLGNQGLNAVNNKIEQNPAEFDTFREQGYAIIDALPNRTATQREAMKRTYSYDSARRRFDGMLNAATKPEDYDAIAAEMANVDGSGRDWQSEILPSDYSQLMNQLGSARKVQYTQMKSTATATMQTLEDRLKDTSQTIPEEELAKAQEQVKALGDSALSQRMAFLARHNQNIKISNRLPPSELKARINTVNGNPGMAYPNLPPVVSSAITNASQKFSDVSVGFLGGLISREAGSKLKKPPSTLNAKFLPQIAHEGVDIRNMRSDIVSAVTDAGEAFGQPLIITKGKGSAGAAGADIATVGMTAVQKADIVGALVDSGFTDVGEYDGYIRVGMSASVKSNFGTQQNGKPWGGWTNLSPEIVNKLVEKGFASGKSSDLIKRNKKPDAEINYDFPTDIKKADGTPASTARGIGQFTNGTWLDTVKDPSVAAAMNLDISGMSDDDLLKLRADPALQVIALAAYASKNRKTLVSTLGRNVNDAELYMAHFMGAGGATQFLTAYKNSPDQSAAELMPSVAEDHKSMFYAGGKALTVGQVYGDISRSFSLSPDQVSFEDNKMNKTILENQLKATADDPMTYATQVGSHTMPDITQEGGWQALGQTALSVSQHYEIPMSKMKPLTVDMENQIKMKLEEGNANKSIELLAGIQSMGAEPAKAAFRQLEQKDPTFAHAGNLYLEGYKTVASDILRGTQKMKENPALTKQLGMDKGDVVNAAMIEATGGALFNTPGLSASTQEAATAYFVEHYGRDGKFSANKFDEAINVVLGGDATRRAIDSVNGSNTFIPKGLDARTIEKAFERISMADLISMSYDGSAPHLADGTVMPVDDMEKVNLRYMGGGNYSMYYDDGSAIVADAPGTLYVLKLDAQRIKTLAGGG